MDYENQGRLDFWITQEFFTQMIHSLVSIESL